MYRCEASSVEGFVQQVAVSFVLHGYHYYVIGEIPEAKDPSAVDAKLIHRYELDISKFARCRRKKEGIAAVQYLRHDRFFVIMATDGEHAFFEKEKTAIRDLRREPLECFRYSLGCYQRPNGRWHPSVRIAGEEFTRMKREFNEAAVRLGNVELAQKIYSLPFAPFAPVRGQFFALLNLINQRRKKAGLPLVVADCVRRRRKPVQVFI